MQWFANNWTRANWFANNWFAGQSVSEQQQPVGGWFGYQPARIKRRDEDEAEDTEVFAPESVLEALDDVPSVVAKPTRKLTRADIDAARAWADGLSSGAVPVVLPALRGFEATFAFPADHRLSEDEAVALVLLLSEV